MADANHQMIELSKADLDAMLDSAAERGAAKVMQNLGLSDERAPHDVRDLRQLITSWREMKSEALKTAAKMVTTAVLTAVVIGLAVQLGITKFLGGGPG